MSPLLLTCSTVPGYAHRTRENADACGLTAAFALDFMTGGERLTRSAAGEAKYVKLPLAGASTMELASILVEALDRTGARMLNVAGNGLYMLSKHWAAFPEQIVDETVRRMLEHAFFYHAVELVRSGGQTGADTAGIRAAVALGVPAHAHLPAGFLYRAADGVDRTQTEAQCRARLLA